MIGQVLGHYRLVEKIGEGGMGEVYRARDEQLDRDVAVKVLPADRHSDEFIRKRLRKEAQTLAKLNHPNIETILEFDSSEGVEFLVVEYIPGVTLSDLVARGPLLEKEMARLGAQLADGLASAHGQGVVHCDLKPGNLRITPEGRLKILDFGIARLFRPEGVRIKTETTADTISGNQALMGTLPYMSPEQLRAERAEAQTDLYSAGAVLYEMATGRRAFREDTAPQMTEAILHQPPVPPRALNPRVSPEMERIILKCLQKESENRYQSAIELEVDLRQLATSTTTGRGIPVPPEPVWRRHPMVTASLALAALAVLIVGVVLGRRLWPPTHPPPPPTISAPAGMRLAVLPFENLTPRSEDEYFADGLTEELITKLSRVRSLEVISRISVMRFKKTSLPPSSIGKQLGVGYIVTGSVRRAGPEVRITVALENAGQDTQVWAESYDRPFKDILAIQNEVAEKVVASLALLLPKDERAALTATPTQNLLALDAYLRGKSLVTQFNNRGREADFVEAEKTLGEAVRQDPEMAAAYAEQAWLYYFHDIERARTSPDLERARKIADRALALDPEQVDALAMLAMMHGWNDENEEAHRYARRVLELNPHNPQALMVLGGCYKNWGLLEEALGAFRRAGQADPLYIYPATNAAVVLVMLGRAEEAWDENEKAASLEAGNWGVLLNRAWIRYYQGRLDEAGHWVADAEKNLPQRERPLAEILSAWVLSREGHHAQARQILRQAERAPILQTATGFQTLLAEGLALENQKSESLDILARTTVKRPNYTWLARDPNFDSLRDDPRFQDLMERLRSQWQDFRVQYQGGMLR